MVLFKKKKQINKKYSNIAIIEICPFLFLDQILDIYLRKSQIFYLVAVDRRIDWKLTKLA